MTYHDHIRQFKRLEAVGNYASALIDLDAAIQVCDVDEALPVLTQMREALTLKLKPQPWYLKLLGVRA